MKKTTYLAIGMSALLLAACGGSGSKDKQGVKFAAKERTSSMSNAMREDAISQKKSELASEVNIDSMLYSRGVKFSVLPPAVDKNLPLVASDKLATRMLQIASSNGIGGLCTNPVLAMVSEVNCVQRELTGTAPQKAIVKYEVTMYCGNLITNDVYASTTQTITGVGATFEDAASKAMNELKNTAEMQKMLQTASERALKWYASTANVKNLVDKAVGEQNYALALAILSSVPEKAEATYAYAAKRNAEVSTLMFQEKAAELLADLEGAIAMAGDENVPEISAYLQAIPQSSSSYASAQKLYDEYQKRVKAVADDKREKEYQERLKVIAAEQEMSKAQIEIMKIKTPYEAQATIEQIKEDASTKKHSMWSGALSSAAESIGNGMRGGMFGENGLFGKGGLFGIGSFADCFGGDE
ncbi:MAG: hypothetical protein MJZ35_08075 [Bacteroidaceae bacterium]|nr:hypothetical protein [Bacteroidaceae bacterium]